MIFPCLITKCYKASVIWETGFIRQSKHTEGSPVGSHAVQDRDAVLPGALKHRNQRGASVFPQHQRLALCAPRCSQRRVHPTIWDSDTDGYCAPSGPGKLQQAYRSTREYYTWKRQQDSRSVSHTGSASSGGPVSHSRAGHCIFASCAFSNCCDKRQVSGEKAM